jgi:hypothetical protein
LLPQGGVLKREDRAGSERRPDDAEQSG